MNNILPYLLNGMLNGMLNNNTNINNQNNNGNMKNINYNQNMNNPNNYQNNNINNNQRNYNNKNNYNNGYNNNPVNNIVGGMSLFGNIFNQVFTTVMNNTELIDNIVDSVLNSEVVSSMINEIDSFELEMEEYEDRYIVSGKFPGVEKKDIQIDYDYGELKIKSKRKQVFNNGTNTMIAIVDNRDDFEKVFKVENIDTTRIKAAYHDNNLKITLFKNNEDIQPIIEVTSYTEE